MRARLMYWCVDRNVPILNPRLMDEQCTDVEVFKVTWPGDARPAFKADVELTRRAIVNEFGDSKLAELLIPGDELVLLNKIPGYADQADEVIVRGRLIGHRFFDVERGDWRFRPLYEAVSEMITRRMGYWAIVNMDKLPIAYDIHKDMLLEHNLPGDRYIHVALSTTNGRYHGVGKLMRGGRIRVVKSWTARQALPPGKPSTMMDFVELNRTHLERKAEKAIEFLKKVFDEYGKLPILVSYSGGKDSLVALDLTYRTGHKFSILFNDTGLEPSETYGNVEEVSKIYNAELIVASAGDSYWRGLGEFGPPARDYRWCCKVIKLAPITRTLLSRFPKGYISVVGERALESSQRAKLPRVSRSRWVARDIVVSPILDWTALEVWGYIFMRNLPYNKAYEYGFDRLGCVICPANELAELKIVSERYPGIYSRFMEELARNIGGGQGLWTVKFGLWRWRRSIPGDLARRVKVNVALRYPLEVKVDEGRILVSSTRPIRLGTLSEFLKMVGDVGNEGNGSLVVRGKHGTAKVYVDDNKVVVESDSRELTTHIAGLVARSSICGECDLCISWCPTGALKRTGPGPSFAVDSSKCIECLVCSQACPSAQYLVYRRMNKQ